MNNSEQIFSVNHSECNKSSNRILKVNSDCLEKISSISKNNSKSSGSYS